eukprot:1196170-Prorocentrum_minimum.AAC.6
MAQIRMIPVTTGTDSMTTMRVSNGKLLPKRAEPPRSRQNRFNIRLGEQNKESGNRQPAIIQGVPKAGGGICIIKGAQDARGGERMRAGGLSEGGYHCA